MDWMTGTSRPGEFFKKYKYLLALILLGMVLLSLPEAPTEEVTEAEETEVPLEAELSQLLSRIQGAGKVEVLLTQARGEEIFYQEDTRQSGSDHSRDSQNSTVLITGSDRTETGLIRQRNPPVYQGAIILCQGADDARIRLALVEAVMDATGLTSGKITVLKMK